MTNEDNFEKLMEMIRELREFADTYDVEVPEAIGRTGDTYHDVREARLAADKISAPLKEMETGLKNLIIDGLLADDDTGAAGLRYRVQSVTKPAVRVTDWDALHQYIAQEERFDFLTKKLVESVVLEAIDAGEDVPGVETFRRVDISVTKI